jgi:hypothetical protein
MSRALSADRLGSSTTTELLSEVAGQGAYIRSGGTHDTISDRSLGDSREVESLD